VDPLGLSGLCRGVVNDIELPVYHPNVVSGLYQSDLDMGPCVGEVSDTNPRYFPKMNGV